MKKLLLVLCLGLFFCYNTQAQIGIRAGLNYAKQPASASLSTGLEIKPKIGFHFGVTYDVSVGTSLTFRPGILYSAKGTKYEFLGETISSSFGYIEIPLYLMYKFGEMEKGFFIQGGPSIGLNMSASQTFGNESEDIKEDVTSTDLGFTLGLGYMINPELSLGLDFTNGFSNLAKDAGPDESVKNQVLGLYIHYKI